jgi:putative phosphoribosyl transferase
MGSLKVLTYEAELLADRQQAAVMLGKQLTRYRDRKNVIVLGIPRGGVILANGLARNLHAELDVVLTRKIRAPYDRELAIGAVTEDGKVYLNQPIVSTLGLSKEYIDRETHVQLDQIRQRKARYRAVLEKKPLNGRVVILTDDGVATGATMQAAIWACRAESPKRLILALPVAPPDALEPLARDAQEVVCLCAPSNFLAISQFYRHFEQVEDERIVNVLKGYSEVAVHG